MRPLPQVGILCDRLYRLLLHLTFIIGFGAIVLVSTDAAFLDRSILEDQSGIAAIRGGSNMAAIHLANAVGGNIFLGFISAVAFATIPAVVSAWRSPAPHRSADITFGSRTEGQRAGRNPRHEDCDIVLGVLAIILGIIFENRMSPSWSDLPSPSRLRNLPVLVMSTFWKGLSRGR
jgi:cation/acetate symporter